jgi:predicted nucleic acid-binding protein
MRRYLLDTGPLGAFLQGRQAAVDLIIPWISRGEVATSILVYGEIIEYIKSLHDYPARYLGLRTLLGAMYPSFLTYAIMERYAEIRRMLRPPHGPGLIGDIDTLIAATALERHLTVVTTDSDYERVPGLKVQRISLKRVLGSVEGMVSVGSRNCFPS